MMTAATSSSQWERIQELAGDLAKEDALAKRWKVLAASPLFTSFSITGKALEKYVERAALLEKYLIASIIAIGQAPIVFRALKDEEPDRTKLQHMLAQLSKVEAAYRQLGGIVGYHAFVLKLLQEKERSGQPTETFAKPAGVDISLPGISLNRYVRWGLESLHAFCEIYPIGGAGDRLDLRDKETGEPLPAALLPFLGSSLFDGLMRDLQAKEYLYYKLFDKQLTLPVVLMVSEEKGNYQRMVEHLESKHWYGRAKERFYFLLQPQVPVVTEEGQWSLSSHLELFLKPGGHGALWKLMEENHTFSSLLSQGIQKAFIRQINNPLGGTDSAALAFCGLGVHMDKAFGFLSCPRELGTAQGMLVQVARPHQEGMEYGVSNIEYTEFAKRGLKDLPEASGSPYSLYPANTNILFIDLKQVQEAVAACPLPGLLINFKTPAPYIDEKGERSEKPAGRLESTMQSISDCITTISSSSLSDEELLKSRAFVAYNDRRKTIAVTKRAYCPGKPLKETPEGCFYEMLQNNYELLKEQCGFSLPPFSDEQSYSDNGPNILFLFLPALGPLYSVVSQKIRRGKMEEGSEFQADIAELAISDSEIAGSLLIEALNPIGQLQNSGRIVYSEKTGKCELNNVKIKNLGIDRKKGNVYWQNTIARKEKLHIILRGAAEFFAEDVTFLGHHVIDVPDGYRFIAYQAGEKVAFHREKITTPTWRWRYTFGADHIISIRKS